MERGFSTIALKSLDEDAREFRGLATSPVPDRVMDIIEPLGAKYRNPTVLLRAHAHDAPIGEVYFDRPTKTGIGFRARIPHIKEPGLLKDRVDMAWGEIKHGLVRAVSVGFRPLETETLKSGGLRFIKSEIFELSTVAVPAQELATIDHVKAIDAAIRDGRQPATVERVANEAGALWKRISAIGRASMDRTRASDDHKQLSGAWGSALVAGNMSTAMIRELCQHVDALERRLTESPLQYRGIWKPDQTYPANSFSTFNGSVWFAEKATSRRPGEGDWVLAVKHGKDAK